MKILFLLNFLFFLIFFKVIEFYKNIVYYWFFEEVFNRSVIDYIGYNDGCLRGSFNIIFGIVGVVLEILGNSFWVDFGVLLSLCINYFEIC